MNADVHCSWVCMPAAWSDFLWRSRDMSMKLWSQIFCLTSSETCGPIGSLKEWQGRAEFGLARGCLPCSLLIIESVAVEAVSAGDRVLLIVSCTSVWEAEFILSILVVTGMSSSASTFSIRLTNLSVSLLLPRSMSASRCPTVSLRATEPLFECVHAVWGSISESETASDSVLLLLLVGWSPPSSSLIRVGGCLGRPDFLVPFFATFLGGIL